MAVYKDYRLSSRAKALRKNMTPQERKLWYLFLRTYPLKIYKQRIIDSYIVDFYCAPAKLVIEIDGSQHYSQEGQEHDQRRSEALARYGIQVLRLSNREVNTELDAVCQMIHQTIQDRIRVL